MGVEHAPRIEVLDDGTSQGRARRLDFTGAGVTATISGDVATVNIPGGGGGSFSNTVLSATPAANQQDWTVSGLADYSTVRASPTDNSFIGGITGGASGRILHLVNSSASGLIWLVHEDAGSTAANRFNLGDQDVFVLPGKAATFIYDSTDSRWRLISVSFDVFNIDSRAAHHQPSSGTTVAVNGIGGSSTTATLSTVSPSGTPTNKFLEGPYVNMTNSTASGASSVRAAIANWSRGPTAGRQGIFFTSRCRFTAMGASGGVFTGLGPASSVTTQFRSTNNTFGFAANGGETTLRVYSRDTTATTAIDLGANFPVPSATAAYDFVLLAMPNTANIRYMVRRLDSDQREQGTITGNLPANTTYFVPYTGVMVGATAVANTAQMGRMFIRAIST